MTSRIACLLVEICPSLTKLKTRNLEIGSLSFLAQAGRLCRVSRGFGLRATIGNNSLVIGTDQMSTLLLFCTHTPLSSRMSPFSYRKVHQACLDEQGMCSKPHLTMSYVFNSEACDYISLAENGISSSAEISEKATLSVTFLLKSTIPLSSHLMK